MYFFTLMMHFNNAIKPNPGARAAALHIPREAAGTHAGDSGWVSADDGHGHPRVPTAALPLQLKGFKLKQCKSLLQPPEV